MSTLSAVKIPAASRHTATLIFLHGLGDQGRGWTFLAEQYRRLGKLDHVAFVFPNAPVQNVSMNFGMQMPSWYDISTLDDVNAAEDETGMIKSVGQVSQLIGEQIDAGIPSERIVLGGFSQGCAVALLASLTSERKLAGIVGLSGYLPLRKKMANMRTEANMKTPVFLGHGDSDPVVKYKFGVATKEALEKMKQPVEWHSYRGLQHSAAPDEIEDLLAFLERVVPEQ